MVNGDAGVCVVQHDEVPGDACGKVAQLGLDRKRQDGVVDECLP